MELKKLFEEWAQKVHRDYVDRQWMLSKWEVVEGIEWPEEKIDTMVETIVAGLDLQETHLAVDLGCGGGWITKLLKGNAGRIIGLDFSRQMLANARVLMPRGEFLCGEIGRLPFKDKTVDRALSYFVFLNFMDDSFVEQALGDVLRILKKGGKALIGQLPDQGKAREYDAAKAAYLDYCQKVYRMGKSTRHICQAPQKLFRKEKLEDFLKGEGIPYHFRDSFNPFYRPGEPKTINWRFDLILEKS